MFRIRRIYDTNNPINKSIVGQIQQILREQFVGLAPEDIEELPEKLMNPFKYKFRSILFVADNLKGKVNGFAILLHAPDLHFCYLDYISAANHITGRGIGGALYERVREEATMLHSKGLFFECLPDDPERCSDPLILKQNKQRLRFYEKYGARPLLNTLYDTPVSDKDVTPPYLVVDPLMANKTFRKSEMRQIVKAILERKYTDICDTDYVDLVINSIIDNPVQLRPFRYIKNDVIKPSKKSIPLDKLIQLVYNNQHAIHHVHEKGYVESPVRVKTVLTAIKKTGLFYEIPARHFGRHHLTAVHDRAFFEYIKKVCSLIPEGESIYPYVFPIRNNTRPPKELPMRAGYYCIDTFTPLNRNAYLAARNAVNCVLTAAQTILDGSYLAYSLVRPPGHHAEKNVFGGFCYFNSTAIGAHYLSKHGKVAILDIDYHHGNGQQTIFYDRTDVLTVSIHGHPRFAYPYFSGFAEEKGEGAGRGFNLNFPLPENIPPSKYIDTIDKAIHLIKRFNPNFLVVALGFDTAQGDPTGTWMLSAEDFKVIGRQIGELPYSTLVVQEGGYKTKTIGKNARFFFQGLWEGSFA